MEFISNLIKRPISLVLNDTAAEQLQSTGATFKSPSPNISPTDEQQRNNYVNNNLNNISNNTKIISSNGKNIEHDDTGGDIESCNVLHSSSSSNATSTTIEELLIQINDNLNQAGLQDDGHQDIPNELSTAALSPLTAKSATPNKLTPSPRPRPHVQTPTTPTTFVASLPNVAAGTAAFETNSSVGKFHIDPELEAELFDESHLVLNNNNTGVNKCMKFVGLTEFDESNIPELPGSLNPNIDDHLTLTFEEDLIPTLTANSHAVFNSTCKRDDTKKALHSLHNEIDTAVSSDNETYAECLSFPDIINTTQTAAVGSVPDLAYNDTTEMSEADTYRSALNSNNNTTTGIVLDQLNDTMENIVEICDELVNEQTTERSQTWQDLVNESMKEDQLQSDLPPRLSATSRRSVDENLSQEDTPPANDITFDEIEPMDVDEMNETLDVPYTTNETLEADPLHISFDRLNNISNKTQVLFPINALDSSGALQNVLELESNNITESFSDNQKVLEHNISNKTEVVEPNNLAESLHDLQDVTELEANNVTDSLDLGALQNISAHNRLTFSLGNEHILTENEPQSRAETSYNVELNVSDDNETPLNQTTTTTLSEKCIIQDNSVDSATDPLPVIVDQNITVVVTTPNIPTAEISSTEIEEVAKSLSPYEKATTSTQKHVVDAKLSIIAPFVTAKKSFPNHLPSFPLKPAMNKKHFPRSPDSEKRCPFMEKSDYADQLKLSPAKNGSASEAKIEHRNENQMPLSLNETINISGNIESQSISPITTSIYSRVSSIGVDNKSISSNRLNCTFDGNSMSASPLMSSSASDMHAMAMLDKRRTLSISPSPKTIESNLKNENSLILNGPFDGEHMKNSDFNTAPKPEKFNQSFEAMEVDTSMRATAAVPQSPPVRTMQRNKNTSITPASELLSCSAAAFNSEILSAKEKIKCNAKDEKDVFVEKFAPSTAIEEMFNSPSFACAFDRMGATDGGAYGNSMQQQQFDFGDDDFQSNNNLILNPSDFDYLLTKGNTNAPVNRSSLLLRFDPLLGVPVPVNQPQQQQLQQILANSNPICLSPTIEEEEQHQESNSSFVVSDKTSTAASKLHAASVNIKEQSTEVAKDLAHINSNQDYSQAQEKTKKNARMSVDVIKDLNIENDCKKSIENSNTQLDEKHNNFKMDELEKKIKNEVLKTEDIEKKLKEAEQREEALIKRITEKDKTIAKMNGVIEAYEKAIAELISEKEQLLQNYEKQLAEVKADRDSNYHHLTSLETTFSDLHVKYEKSKEMTSQLKSSEESLLAEKKQNLENLRLQEQRYEKMKNHAMQQLEIANRKLESLTKEHAIESTKLKALLKKEEISRASINEQLLQKSRENSELVKICDELINGQGS